MPIITVYTREAPTFIRGQKVAIDAGEFFRIPANPHRKLIIITNEDDSDKAYIVDPLKDPALSLEPLVTLFKNSAISIPTTAEIVIKAPSSGAGSPVINYISF